jgi:hypothetical protein
MNGRNRPKAASQSLHGGGNLKGSVTPAGDHQPLVDLCVELSPGTPRPVLESLVWEALNTSACVSLDADWAQARQRLYPEAVRCAHSRHTVSYAERRAVELAAVRGSS